MTYPGIIFWLLVVWATFSRGPAIYYVFFTCSSLGTLAALPPQLSIGNLTPAWIAACFLTVRIILEDGPSQYFGALVDLRRFGFLSLCTLYAVASSYFLPRFFAGRVDVIEMRLQTSNVATALAPNGSNLCQALYFLITTLNVVDVYFIGRDPQKRKQFLMAFGWGAAVAVGTGVLDLVTNRAGLAGLLAPFRNATYVLMIDNDAMSMHRVVGLMSEASAYAGLCLPFLCLLALTPSRNSPWGRWRAPLCVALVVMTYLSTSSGGYVALGAVAAIVAIGVAAGMAEGRTAAWWGGFGILLSVSLVAALLFIRPEIFQPLYHMIDVMVLHKSSSASYIERSYWNRVSYQAFLHTHLLGAGVGGSRASSWIYALLSNIGLPGTALLAIFLLQTLLARAAEPSDRALARAVKLALLPSLLIISLSGSSVGFGLGASILFGLTAAICWPAAKPSTALARVKRDRQKDPPIGALAG